MMCSPVELEGLVQTGRGRKKGKVGGGKISLRDAILLLRKLGCNPALGRMPGT